ncbi:hypothetical protein TrispH2_008690 [Trichoplax sp. H2]|nr:hypothetical protein TrispH2_008690 [Trichoplax sp. H2]|eukprot:RDD39262.1 hypothetical protein TrispH2_008690 [Trichoplax sp. H2]
MSGKQKLVNQYWTARRNYRRIATKERIYNEDNTAPIQDRSESKRPSTRSTVSVKLTTNDNINDQRNESKCQTTSDVINQQPEKATAESPLNSPGQKRKLQSSSLSNNTETKTKLDHAYARKLNSKLFKI